MLHGKPFPLLVCSLLLFVSFSLSAQNRLFNYSGELTATDKKDMVQKATRLTLNRDVLDQLYTGKLKTVKLEIPLKAEVLKISLKKADLFAQNFETVISSTLENYDYEKGYYLQGKIDGKENSLVAISIFKNNAAGVLSFNGDNYNLCIANNYTDFNTNDYILYGDKDCTAPRPLCFADDKGDGMPISVSSAARPNQTEFVGCPVDIHFEAAYRMYTTLGNVNNVMNYVTTVFNFEQLLYSNENILVQIREVIVWNTPDPENAITTSGAALTSFATRMIPGFNGDLAHYMTFAGLGGGVAYLDVLCSSSRVRTGVSGNMAANYAAFPNFSFSIEVITHEMGHNMSSRHTQSCTWPGGAIDNCYTTEGGCPPGPAPVNGGTIMSYCHLASYGINFANGFGPLPGNKVRNGVTVASANNCICNCANIQLDITKTDIGCSATTGTATAVVTNGTGPFTYLWSNGATGASVTGLAAGTYYVKVTGSTASCTVIKGFKIVNTGSSTVAVSVTPAATSITKCIGETYTVTASTTSGGTISYQWYKNGAIIPGEIAAAYTITAGGTYYVIINNGSCAGQSSTINATYQNITAPMITVNGASSVCSGDSVRLSIPSTTFSVEWKLNGAPLPGATTVSFYAKLPGNYTVRLYNAANASCSAESNPVSISVLPVPSSATTPSGNVDLCMGYNVLLQHTAVAGETYQWYNGSTAIPGATNTNYSATTAGSYALTVTGANTCKSKSSFTIVSFHPLPDSAISPAGPVDLCTNGSLQLMIIPTSGANYTWYNHSALLTTSPSNIFTVTSGGKYSAVIKDPVYGCYSTSDSVTINMIPPPRIFAGNDTILSTGQPYQLHVRELTSLGVNQYQWSPATGLDNRISPDPVTVLYADQQYIVSGRNALGCFANDTVKIKVYKGPAIYVPSAFSPNGDGNNDQIRCIAVGMRSFKYFSVFNRLGEKIFYSTNPLKGWDGNIKNKPAMSGAYVWIAEAVDHTGKPVLVKGSFMLIR